MPSLTSHLPVYMQNILYTRLGVTAETAKHDLTYKNMHTFPFSDSHTYFLKRHTNINHVNTNTEMLFDKLEMLRR